MPPSGVSPTMAVSDWRAGYAVKNSNNPEIISGMLFDKQLYVSAATTQLTFFNTLPANRFAGNMQLAGQLPSGNSFLVQAIRLGVVPSVSETISAATATGLADGALQDVTALLRDAIVTLFIGQKDYGTWPALALPGGFGPGGSMSNVGTSAAGAASQFQQGLNGPPDPRAVYSLGVPLAIPEQYNFRLALDFAAAVTLVGGNMTVIAMLDGELMRPSQ